MKHHHALSPSLKKHHHALSENSKHQRKRKERLEHAKNKPFQCGTIKPLFSEQLATFYPKPSKQSSKAVSKSKPAATSTKPVAKVHVVPMASTQVTSTSIDKVLLPVHVTQSLLYLRINELHKVIQKLDQFKCLLGQRRSNLSQPLLKSKTTPLRQVCHPKRWDLGTWEV